MTRAVKDADVLKLDRPIANQGIEYYQNFLQHIAPMIGLFDVRLGYLRFLQGSALNEAVDSRKVRHGEYGRLLTLLGVSRTVAYNSRMVAKQIPAVNARRLGFTEMMRICGLINDQVEEIDTFDDDDDDFDLVLAEEEYEEGESPLPSITFHNFLPKLESVRDTLDAIGRMDYGAESRDEALERYLEAQKHVQQIKRHCVKVERLIVKRIGSNRKNRRTRNSA